MANGVVHLFRSRRRFRYQPLGRRYPSSGDRRLLEQILEAKQGSKFGASGLRKWTRLSTIRLVVLVGVLVALFATKPFERGDQFKTSFEGSSRPTAIAVSEVATFTLCSWRTHTNCVVDGDTIKYAGLKIRLEDIDTPETYEYKCEAELTLGKRATNRMLELINAGPFELVNRSGRDEDRYGRKLRTVERGGRSLGDVLVTEGLARRWDGRRHGWC